MYRVIIADPEPLVLYGLRSLATWGENGCEIIDTAQDGQCALDLIRKWRPEIVICDIEIPLISGLDLLRLSAEEENAPVFIMLSKQKDYDQLRASMRLGAIDCLLKMHLTSESLEEALLTAKKSWSKTRILQQAFPSTNTGSWVNTQVFRRALLSLYKGENLSESFETLEYCRMGNDCSLLWVLFDFLSVSRTSDLSAEELDTLFVRSRALLEQLLHTHCKDYFLFWEDQGKGALCVYLWNTGSNETLKQCIDGLYLDFMMFGESLSHAGISFLCTNRFESIRQALLPFVEETYLLMQEHYLGELFKPAYAWQLEARATPPMVVTTEMTHLLLALHNKDIPLLRETLGALKKTLTNTSHTREEGVDICRCIYTTATAFFAEVDCGITYRRPFFRDESKVLDAIAYLTNRKQVIHWICKIEAEIIQKLEALIAMKSNLSRSVQDFVEAHIGERITVSEVAAYVGFSPGYLSSIFKEKHGMSLMYFINSIKIKHACALIDGKHLICEISTTLGFNNPNYFAKVFKKHTGMTPKKYERR